MTPDDLRRRRTALGLSLTKLGEALGADRMTIHRWEKGTLTIERPAMLDLALEALETRAKRARAKDAA